MLWNNVCIAYATASHPSMIKIVRIKPATAGIYYFSTISTVFYHVLWDRVCIAYTTDSLPYISNGVFFSFFLLILPIEINGAWYRWFPRSDVTQNRPHSTSRCIQLLASHGGQQCGMFVRIPPDIAVRCKLLWLATCCETMCVLRMPLHPTPAW